MPFSFMDIGDATFLPLLLHLASFDDLFEATSSCVSVRQGAGVLEWRPKKHFQAFFGQYWGPNVKIRVDTHAFLMLMCHN